MKLVLLTIALLLGSSAVFAAERYTEVWNPPEVQSAKGKSKPRTATQTAARKKRKSATAVKQVAERTAVESLTGAGGGAAAGLGAGSGARGVPGKPSALSRKPAEPVIPRKIEPNGQVMRV